MNTTGLTVQQLVYAHPETLLVHEGIIFKRWLLPFFVPHLVTFNHDQGTENYLGTLSKCNTSIRLANTNEIKKYIYANQRFSN